MWSFRDLGTLEPFAEMDVGHPCLLTTTCSEYRAATKPPASLRWKVHGVVQTVSVPIDTTLFMLHVLVVNWNLYRVTMDTALLAAALDAIDTLNGTIGQVKQLRYDTDKSLVVSDETWKQLRSIWSGVSGEREFRIQYTAFSGRTHPLDEHETVDIVRAQLVCISGGVSKALLLMRASSMHAAVIHVEFAEKVHRMAAASANMFHYFVLALQKDRVDDALTAEHMRSAMWFTAYLGQRFLVYFPEFRSVPVMPEWLIVACTTINTYSTKVFGRLLDGPEPLWVVDIA